MQVLMINYTNMYTHHKYLIYILYIVKYTNTSNFKNILLVSLSVYYFIVYTLINSYCNKHLAIILYYGTLHFV